MIEELRTFLADHPDLLPNGPVDIAGTIVAGIDREASAKVTFLLFDRRGEPSIAAKVARRPSADRSLSIEYAVLSQLSGRDSSIVRTSVPRPIALTRIRGRLAMLATALPGGPMTARYYTPGHTSDPVAVAEDFLAASSWLRRFQGETRTGSIRLDEQAAEAWVGGAFQRLAEEPGWRAIESGVRAVALERARRLRGIEIPVSAVHGDYWMGNLLMSGGDITGAIDWELGRSSGLPFADVYKFPTSYAFYLDRVNRSLRGDVRGHPERSEFERRWSRYGDWPNLAGFAYGYYGRGWFPEQVRRFVLGHLAWLGLPPAVNGVFFPLFLAQQATALDVPRFREGYRALLRAMLEEDGTWLWGDALAPSDARR
jgi:hypothetical protein